MDDDDFGADADFLAALAASDVVPSASAPVRQPPKPQATPASASSGTRPPTTPRIQQLMPQRMPRPGAPPAHTGPRIVQPTPQALSGPSGGGGQTPSSSSTGNGGGTGGAGQGPRPFVPSSGSAILVSPRQKGNPVVNQLRSVPWEYSDILADYGLGHTTCALFLSLKYHRLHPEYIYKRIQGLQGKFRLRVLLAMVDIDNHEEALRELAKTSLVNNVTLVLCWSAAEAARYLELYKSFEHASGFAAIRGQQAAGYAERLVQFATVPRAVHKADAVALVSAFGSLRRAVEANAEQLGQVQGWGEKKIQGWRRAVEAPFRVQKGARRGGGKKMTTTKAGGEAGAASTQAVASAAASGSVLDQAIPLGRVPQREVDALAQKHKQAAQARVQAAARGPLDDVMEVQDGDEDMDDDAGDEATAEDTQRAGASRLQEEKLDDGIAAALARLRENG